MRIITHDKRLDRLVIRKEQMDIIANYARQLFEDQILAHLKRIFPTESSAISEDELILLIHNGIVKSAEYGIVIEDDVRRFIELMLVHGADFDRHAWAVDFLYKKPLDYPSQTVDFLVALSSNQIAQD